MNKCRIKVTTCEHLHDLRPTEELALFTYSCLLTPGQIQIVSVGDLLTDLHQPIHLQHMGDPYRVHSHGPSLE